MTMKYTPITGSTNVKMIGYDDDLKTLHVTFKGNRTYAVQNVPMMVYQRFLNAKSKGVFYHEHIKNKYIITEIP